MSSTACCCWVFYFYNQSWLWGPGCVGPPSIDLEKSFQHHKRANQWEVELSNHLVIFWVLFFSSLSLHLISPFPHFFFIRPLSSSFPTPPLSSLTSTPSHSRFVSWPLPLLSFSSRWYPCFSGYRKALCQSKQFTTTLSYLSDGARMGSCSNNSFSLSSILRE